MVQGKFSTKFFTCGGRYFQSLKLMAECEYHILHVSTDVVSECFFDINQSNSKVFYPKSFEDWEISKMIL